MKLGAPRPRDLWAEAHQALLESLTNDVVGLRSVILAYVNTNQMTGLATVEYINEMGGVQRRDFECNFVRTFYSSNANDFFISAKIIASGSLPQKISS